MAEEQVERRLAAILAADVVGYSRLMEANEERTLGALRQHRREFFDPTVAKHKGRIFKMMGDGFLVEFGSVLDAARCAVEIQRGMPQRNAGVPEDRHIKFRIGINLGDLIVDGDDFQGDGVNIAARLEGLAGPGGIACSATVRTHIGNRLELEFIDQGEKTVKNIAQPVHVYFINLETPAAPDPARAKPLSQDSKSMPGREGLNSDPLYLSTLAGLGKSLPGESADPPRDSIAVLPFVNMSGDPEQEFFTDGLTEDIITDLSNVPGFFVIARNSTFAYKGKPTDVRRIAHDLGVKYILEGSARRSAQRLRINAQLIDAADGGNHVWAERFDRDISDIFAVQDEVTRRVVESISGKLGIGPIVERRRPSNLEAYDLCVRSRNLWGMSRVLNHEAHALLARAVALDPNYAEAHWQMALVQLFAWHFFGENEDPNRRDAVISAERAVDLDTNDSNARWVLAYVLLHERRWDEANAQFEVSLRINPNGADALAIISDFKISVGLPEEALEYVARALRLNPQPPPWYYWLLGQAQIANGQYDLAVATLRRQETYRTASRRLLAAALAMSGRVEEAREEAKFFLADNPQFRVTTWLENGFFKNQKVVKFWFDAYLLAGLPE